MMIEVLLVAILILAVVALIGWRSYHDWLLAHQLERWRREGWIEDSGVKAILADAKNRHPGLAASFGFQNRLVFLLALLGMVLLLFSAISFVAANWQEMSRLARLTCTVGALWLTYLIAWRLRARGYPLLSEVTYGLGVGLFGVNIAYIAQIFHIDSHPPGGVLMWTLGALATAALLESRAALLLAFLGVTTWSLMEITAYGVLFHWPFLIVWGLAALLAGLLRWQPGAHLALLTLLLWLIMSLVRFGMDADWPPQGLLAVILMVFVLLLAFAFILHENRYELLLGGFDNWLEFYALIGVIVSLFALQTAEMKQAPALALSDPSMVWLPVAAALLIPIQIMLVITWREKLLRWNDYLALTTVSTLPVAFATLAPLQLVGEGMYEFLTTWVFGAAFLAMMIWLMMFAHRRRSDSYIFLALTGFGAEILYIYLRIFGSLLETSLFFLIGGVLTLGLSILLYKLYQRLEKTEAAT